MPSFSLIPQNDPTLLLVGAGMAPLKPYFTGEKKPPHPRVATCQKCIRTPDIERVGHTGRHATFFEMLGNFSFGDYFKEEAIAWAWDLVLNGYRLPLEKLWISIYEEDEEAYQIWHEKIGVPPDRIVRLGKEDNFWEIGLGPCGPCSEIYIDLGETAGCGKPGCAVGCDCDRYLEIWNLVFTQFSREADGSLVELKQKNIDTGAGLERLAIALQGVNNLYETDQVKPLFNYFTSVANPSRRDQTIPLKIVTEHSRGTTFMIADGVTPSNEGRGYVLRRLLRRAVRYGKLLGMEGTFMTDAVDLVIDIMASAYPELKERHDYISQVVKLEEQKFQETLAQGMDILDGYIENMRRQGDLVLPGEMAFKLYDTYGFPLDLTAEIITEQGLQIDRDAFSQNLKQQQERARAASRNSHTDHDSGKYKEAAGFDTIFTGYDRLEQPAKILFALSNGKVSKKLKEGDNVEIIFDQTPFYAEAGGQLGDSGTIEAEAGIVKITNTLFSPLGQIIHQGEVKEGFVAVDDSVKAKVDPQRRRGITRSHTSTHLLHRALRNQLGDHVNQAGSLVAPERLRFDFNHFSALSHHQILELEAEVNTMIMANLPIQTKEMSLEEAKESGATALFTEKYDETVRIVSAGEYTNELCGGTHVCATGEIGLFKIVTEEGIGSGLRRIEAVVGMSAYCQTVKQEELLAVITDTLNTDQERLEKRFSDYVAEHKQLVKTTQALKQRLAVSDVDSLFADLTEIDGVKVLNVKVEAGSLDELRVIMDAVKSKLSSIVVVLAAVEEDKVMLVGSVTSDLVSRGINASKLIKEVARQVDGGGGGKPELAQAGGKNPEALPKALDSVAGLVRDMLQST